MEMITNYKTGYTAPNGLSEDDYCGLMNQLMEFVQSKGLTIRQAQKLFIDCSDMVLDCNCSTNHDKNKLSDIDRLVNKLDDIKIRLEDIYKSNSGGLYWVHTDNPQS